MEHQRLLLSKHGRTRTHLLHVTIHVNQDIVAHSILQILVEEVHEVELDEVHEVEPHKVVLVQELPILMEMFVVMEQKRFDVIMVLLLRFMIVE